METIRKIRTRYRSGASIRSISLEFHVSRNTVRKFLRETAEKTPNYTRGNPHYPKLGPYIEKIHEILEIEAKSKLKRTWGSIYEEMRSLGFQGSYSAVCRYIKKQNQDISKISGAYVPLVFESGEAYQFDWSTENIELKGKIITIKVAHFVLCHSRYKFTYAYPCETQEMVFDAHVRAFEFFGGVPKYGIYDNMKTAVTKVLKGKDREWNPAFERLCSHYRIEPVACNPSSGWEKGRVERQVEIDRNLFFLPIPKVSSLAELNQILCSQLIAYNQAHHHPEYKDKTLLEMYQLEQPSLARLPIAFTGARYKDIKVSSTCLAMFDRNQYSVDCHYAGKIVQCKAYADKLIFICNGKEIATHERRFSIGQIYYDWKHYLPLLMRKPGALRNGAPFKEMHLPEELQIVRQHLHRQSGAGAKNFVRILSYIPQMTMEAVQAACGKAIQAKTISSEVILNILLRSEGESSEQSPLIPNYLMLKFEPIADCSRYNFLLKGGRSC